MHETECSSRFVVRSCDTVKQIDLFPVFSAVFAVFVTTRYSQSSSHIVDVL